MDKSAKREGGRDVRSQPLAADDTSGIICLVEAGHHSWKRRLSRLSAATLAIHADRW
jgi:hypothetical protein